MLSGLLREERRNLVAGDWGLLQAGWYERLCEVGMKDLED